MRGWLQRHRILFTMDMLHPELLELCKLHKSRVLVFRIDKVLKSHGHTAIRLPNWTPSNWFGRTWKGVSGTEIFDLKGEGRRTHTRRHWLYWREGIVGLLQTWILEERYSCGGRGWHSNHFRLLRQRHERFGGHRHSLRGQRIDGHCHWNDIVHVIWKIEIILAIVVFIFQHTEIWKFWNYEIDSKKWIL